MRALKTCLWVLGVLCLLAVFGLFLPLSALESLAKVFGDQPLQSAPVFAYGLRVGCLTYVAIGIFFVILARDPMRYGVLVPFSGVAAVLVGLCCGVIGLLTHLPLLWFVGDFFFATVLGILILVFWRRAVTAGREPQSPEA